MRRSRFRRRVLTALSLALSLTAAAGAASPPDPRPSLVLVTLDTTRADHLGSYGWEAARTPVLDALAARGSRFARCDASAPITLPSHCTLFTGLFPPRHGVRDNGTFQLAASFTTVAEQLRAAGYDTGAAVAAVVLGSRYGVAQGFRLFDETMQAPAPGVAAEERDAMAVTDAALTLLPQLAPPFFLWVHYYDPHVEYRAPDAVAAGQGGPTAAYDAEIAYVDRELGRLLAALPGGTALVVVGDHGEMLGDHGEATHGVLLHAGARRVPLLLAGPGVPAGRVVDALVRTADVAPTLLELAGAPPLPDVDGRSLLPLLGAGEAAPRLSYSEAFMAFYAYRWHPLRALSDGRRLFVDGVRPRLFDLTSGGEERDLAAERPQETASWRARLWERLSAWGDADGVPEPSLLGGEARDQLLALGYLGGLGGDAPTDLAELPDPYELVDVAAALHDLGRQVQQGDCAAALPELKDVLRRNRDNLPALNMAGICRMEAGDYRGALGYFEHAVKVHPESAIARANLAGSFLRLDRRADAEAAYRDTLKLDPTQPTAVANLARLLRERGASKEATDVLAAAFDAGGSQVRWFLERGLIAADAGRLEAALADFTRVVAAEPQNVEALENAARAAYHLRRAAEAVALYQRLLALQPERGDVWKTLGAVQLYELDDVAGARVSFAAALRLERDPGERAELEAVLRELR